MSIANSRGSVSGDSVFSRLLESATLIERPLVDLYAKYITQSTTDFTHQFFGAGIVKLAIPIQARAELHSCLTEYIQHGGRRLAALVERVAHEPLFRLFVDLDLDVSTPLDIQDREAWTRDSVIRIKDVVSSLFGEDLANTYKVAVRVPGKVHVVWPDVIVNAQTA
ncbi:hypothetical protein HDU93_006885, partial [Gonapodya sp. JEL0774]